MKQSLILMLMTIISKISGLLREISLSYVYGTSNIADAFLVSFFIPSIIINAITIGISVGFIPIYTKILNNQSQKVADNFVNNLIIKIIFISTIISILGITFTENILSIVATGLDPKTMSMAIFFTQMVMTSIVFSTIGGVYTGYLHVHNYFSITVLNKIIMNGIIILFIFLSFKYDYKILAIGTALGMSLQYLVFIPALRSIGYKFSPKIGKKDKNLQELKKIALPFLIIVVTNDLNLIIDKAVASTLEVGAISALNYSSGIQDFVSGVVILSIVTIRYTEMSKLSITKNMKILEGNYNQTLKMTLFLVIPATIGLMVFSKEIIELLFFRGAFDYESLITTSRTLFFYSFGLVGIALNTVGQRVYFSLKHIKIPIVISIFSVIINIIFNIILSRILGIIGLSIATSIVMITSGVILNYLLNKKDINIKSETIKYGVLKTTRNSLLVILIAKGIHIIFPRNIILIILIILSIAVYIYMGVKSKIIYLDDLKKVSKKG